MWNFQLFHNVKIMSINLITKMTICFSLSSLISYKCGTSYYFIMHVSLIITPYYLFHLFIFILDFFYSVLFLSYK